VNVGIYENASKVFTSGNVKQSGIFADIIENIAKAEGWVLRFVPGGYGRFEMSDKLVIIEENKQNFYMMRFLLEKKGFKVFGAENGRGGIEMALNQLPLAILQDIQLPDIDEYAVAAELKKHKELDDIPIIAVTSYVMAGDGERILAAGATGYIEKPINPETFVAEIMQFLPQEF
jgi:two-component system, cell cycle response regulator DivK